MNKRVLSGIAAVICIIAAITLYKNKSNNTVEADSQGIGSQIINNEKSKSDEEVADTNKDDVQNKIEELQSILNDDMFILVNRENLLDKNYEPNNLVASEFEFLDYIQTRMLTKDTADAAKKMFDAAAEDGVQLLGASGYRSYSIQENLYNSRVNEIGAEEAGKYTAPPGGSEHQTGLALDILGADYVFMDDGFENSTSFKWLRDNAYKYGFILRYPKEKENITGYSYEPWHYRYIGNVDIAQYITENGLTFEEYIDGVKQQVQILGQ